MKSQFAMRADILDRVKIMRREGLGWYAIQRRLHVNIDPYRKILDPEFGEAERLRHQKRRRDMMAGILSPGAVNGPRFQVPQAVLDERDRRYAAPMTLTALVFGDPPQGYSALERRRA